MIETQCKPCSILLTGQQEIKEETDADPVVISEKHITSTPQKKRKHSNRIREHYLHGAEDWETHGIHR